MVSAAWGEDDTRFFFSLTPERVLESVEHSGLHCTGRCQALNSFENRVYDVELDLGDEKNAESKTSAHRIIKFYRPGRWTLEQILEEHEFLQDLIQAEIPVVAPIAFPDGRTLHEIEEGKIKYALFPRVGGRAPEELTDDQLRWVGRLLGRIHQVGKSKDAPHRVELNTETYGRANLEFLLRGNWIPLEFQERYRISLEGIFAYSDPLFQEISLHRIHGDCHLGNLLWNQMGPFFLDFDDMLRGPAIQDFWLLISGRDQYSRRALALLIEGYEEIGFFERKSLKLIEPLRALRFVHYSAWIARRWKDPAFPLAFPQFGSHRYWSDATSDLEEQRRLIEGEFQW